MYSNDQLSNLICSYIISHPVSGWQIALDWYHVDVLKNDMLTFAYLLNLVVSFINNRFENGLFVHIWTVMTAIYVIG